MKIEGETKRLPQFRPFLLFFPSSIIIPETSDGIKFDIRMQCNIVTSFYCIRILLIIISIFVIQNTVSLESLESIESKVSLLFFFSKILTKDWNLVHRFDESISRYVRSHPYRGTHPFSFSRSKQTIITWSSKEGAKENTPPRRTIY